ncbi:hypothetical protein ZEAMMB73_Zm00001d049446 [Zea mays]|uniref:Uncharacterized protein n=1 Tax=Zea mays TaxID=4577 RepID=A0A1D6PUT3_MAIZE|nr:hypothetical protein ZEAMMB73_Zm00001d049446 [Zea mays]
MLQGFHDSGFHAEKPLLVLPSCLLLLLLAPLVSAVPMPRSLRLGSHQQHPPTLKLSSSQVLPSSYFRQQPEAMRNGYWCCCQYTTTIAIEDRKAMIITAVISSRIRFQYGSIAVC